MNFSKQELRSTIKQKLASIVLSDVQKKDYSIDLLEQFKIAIPSLNHKESNKIISLYHSKKHEIEVSHIANYLLQLHYRVAMPVVNNVSNSLVFKEIDFNSEYELNKFNIKEPVNIDFTVIPDIVVAPLLAFSRSGFRLGMGGGYYDKTLAILTNKPLYVGVAYSWQEYNNIVNESHDVKLDIIITNKEIINIQNTI